MYINQQIIFILIGGWNEDEANVDYSRGQDLRNPLGKILRIDPQPGRHDEGYSVPEDNPFGNYVYSYGHRNPQGLTWDDAGRLWSTEHGRSGALSGLDELNLVENGKNYGWPEIHGQEIRAGMETPKLHSGQFATWAPAGAAYVDGSIFFGGLRGEALYEAIIDGSVGGSIELRENFKNEFGRIREVILGPDGAFYITTSNRDGRGSPVVEDDRVIRIALNLIK